MSAAPAPLALADGDEFADDEPADDEPTPDAPASSDDDLAARARALADQASALALPRDADRALELYEQALALRPIDVDALAGVARAELARRHPERALDPARRAAGLAPNRSSFRVLLGDVHLALGDRDAARAAWLEAEALHPSARLRQRLDAINGTPDTPQAPDTRAPGTSATPVTPDAHDDTPETPP